MIHKRARLLACILVPIILLTACSNGGQSGASASPSPSPSASVRPSPSPSLSPSPSPDVTYIVKTDYSQLTPYKPLEEIFTRLSEDYMPKLIPSDDYGLLVPYIGQAIYGEYGLPLCYTYGLMTTSGKIVTDAVYSSISPLDDGLPVYILERQNDGYISEDAGHDVPYRNPDNASRYALCAADGSWVTAFDYADVIVRSQTVMLIRDEVKNDADVYDLSGKFLYNTTRMAYSGKIQEQAFLHLDDFRNKRDISYSDIIFSNAKYMGAMEDHYGEGFYPVEMTDGKFAYIQELTGEITYTDFDEAGEFSDGLAAVSRDNKWGYININFKIIIPLQYKSAGSFFSGYSFVGLAGDKYVFINSSGKQLLECDKINLLYDLYHIEQNGTGSYYDTKLNKMTPDKKSAYMNAIGDGWYISEDGDQCELFYDGKKYVFPSVTQVLDVTDGLVECQGQKNNNWGESLLTLDGKTIIRFLEKTVISLIKNAVSGEIYIRIYNRDASTTRITNLSGTTLLSCDGSIIYNEAANLFGIQTDDYFSYVDMSGNCTFRISLMDDIPD